QQVASAVADGRFRRAGQTTQFMVGATDESDREIGKASAWLYQKLGLARVYYSAFQPARGTPLEERPPTSFVREHRLYQMDFLLRKYGFGLEEIPFVDQGMLPVDADPKTMWARLHPERFPIEINNAAFEELVRVPGIGPTSARRLLDWQARGGLLRDPSVLHAAGASLRLAAPFVLLCGKAPPRQLDLFR
ncbi:MAG: putative DNA modification/repair radical SAM protein, partial [Pseudomonadota bacterium]